MGTSSRWGKKEPTVESYFLWRWIIHNFDVGLSKEQDIASQDFRSLGLKAALRFGQNLPAYQEF